MTVDIKSTYYVRVAPENRERFEQHLDVCKTDYTMLSLDVGQGTTLYSIKMDGQEALSLKLSFPLVGCMNFTRTLGKQKEQS